MIVDPNVKAREIAHPPTTTLVGAHCRRNLTQEGTMTSCGQYLLSPKVFEVQESQLAKPGADEVQIALRSTTICGSDLHYYAHARNGSIKLKEPLCLGHETAGEVVDVGISVVNLQAGDKVALECGVPCSQCELCLAQRYNLCPELRFRGSGAAFPHFQGSLQVKVNHPARWVHKLPPTLGFEDGALLEPLSVACHATRRAQVVPATTCLVIGAGAIGLLCAAMAIYKGCRHIVICDIDERRVDFAVKNGFAHVGITVQKKPKPSNVEEEMSYARDFAEEIASLTWPNGGKVGKLSVTFECTGVPSCVQTSIFSTKSGGRVMVVGMGNPNHLLPLSEAGAREIDLMPTWRYADCYDESIRVMNMAAQATFKPDIRLLITHRFTSLESVPEAFAAALQPERFIDNLLIKAVINY